MTVLVGATGAVSRAMTDFPEIDDRGRGLNAVEILGLTAVPRAGDVLEVAASDQDARSAAAERADATETLDRRQPSNLEQYASQIGSGDARDLNLIIKADTQGSLEALRSSISRLGNEATRPRSCTRTLAQSRRGCPAGNRIRRDNPGFKLAYRNVGPSARPTHAGRDSKIRHHLPSCWMIWIMRCADWQRRAAKG